MGIEIIRTSEVKQAFRQSNRQLAQRGDKLLLKAVKDLTKKHDLRRKGVEIISYAVSNHRLSSVFGDIMQKYNLDKQKGRSEHSRADMLEALLAATHRTQQHIFNDIIADILPLHDEEKMNLFFEGKKQKEQILVEKLRKKMHGEDAPMTNIVKGKIYVDVNIRTFTDGYDSFRPHTGNERANRPPDLENITPEKSVLSQGLIDKANMHKICKSISSTEIGYLIANGKSFRPYVGDEHDNFYKKKK